MTATTIKRLLIIVSTGLFLLLPEAVEAKEKLKIFILAGQSNTVGHARAHTIATLHKSGKASDKVLIDMVYKDDSVAKAIDGQLARAKKIDALIIEQKTADAAKKDSLQQEIDTLKAAHEAYKKAAIEATATSDRVYVSSIADRNLRSGKLGIGYGADAQKIGTEYGFGLSIAEEIDGPILLIKTSWGGKSITYDFRPPSAPDFKSTVAYENAKTKAEEQKIRYDEAIKNFPAVEKKYAADLAVYQEKMKTADAKAKKRLREPRKPKQPRPPRPFSQDNAGHFWREMVKHVETVLASPGEYHPAYDDAAGYEIAGFVWFQGFNDQFDPEYRGNYAENMRLFINDARKTFKTPKMPVVIGVLGTAMTKEKVDANEVSQAQRKAAQFPEFAGSVRAVESYVHSSAFSYEVFQRGWKPHYHEWDTVGSDRPYHYLGSGAFFVRLGDDFANNMVELIETENQ